jgi:methylphosphotriester-DNA--protein-cysteine methyltransferase
MATSAVRQRDERPPFAEIVSHTQKGLAISQSRMFVGWRRDRWFCRQCCSTLKDQPAGDRAFISSRTRAEEMGYQPCDVCRPDLPLLQ